MFWKNLIVLAGLAWVTTTYAAGKIASETMDDALGHKIEKPHSKSQKRGVAQEGHYDESLSEQEASDEPQFWNWEAGQEQDAEQFESVEDESEY